MAKAIAILVLLLISPAAYAATTHIVGGDSGWTTDVNYDSWAGGQNFTIGDTLLFNYDVISHAVYEVNVDDYNDCFDEDPINVYTSSPTIIPLSTASKRYFICPRSNHCARGLKLEVTVMAGSSNPGGAPPPSTTPLEDDAIAMIDIPDSRDILGGNNRLIHVVGGIHGWTNYFNVMAFELKAFIGDIVLFNYDDVTNAVYEVSVDDYNDCNNDNPINVYTSSPTSITLTTVSPRYFISPRSNNCKLGQKLAITVRVRRDISPSSAPSPSSTTDIASGLVGPMD